MGGNSNSHPRPCSGKKTLRRCRNNDEADKVILIDVDSENCDKVVIIDIPESLPKKNQESHRLKKDEKCFRNVINIDDDETPDSNCLFGVNNVSFSAGTSLNRESFCVAMNFGDSTDSSDEDCQFVQDSATPVRLSKCKRTYSGSASKRNRYALDTDSECDLSDNGYPDCELMEDSSGKVQELWEKAFSKRRKDIDKVHSGIRGHDGTSRCINEDDDIAESKNATWHHGEASFCHTTNDDFGFTHLSDDAVDDQNYDKSGPCRKSNSQAKRRAVVYIEQEDCLGCEQFNTLQQEDCLGCEQFNTLQQEDCLGCEQFNILQQEVSACIIHGREKRKETDEYKRAIEEEWASKQQVMQIQAEEIQRERQLQKRRKAESMRLLDMQRRQKQRLEEIRSTQKKDEENMNLKDSIRAEVRNELKKLEVGCKNMASLLHKLGITVGSWPTPSPQEIHAAYKRALLTFHPDRASRSDIRQLVEAEEKIKLINRLKDKFQPF